jgi:molybdate transport system ATP-binding protein
MIEIRVRKSFDPFVVDVDFAAPARGITALFGRSGAGKTSVLKAVAGALRPDDGRIVVGDRLLFDGAERVDLPIEQRRIGYVFQDARLFPHLGVRANLAYGQKRLRQPGRFRFDDVVGLLGLAPLLERRTHALSGGERQRVAIGRALLADPSLLLMDEPLASLDPPRRSELLAYIEGLRDDVGLPVLYISHMFDEVVRLADHLVVLDGGRVVRSGPLIELASDPALAPLIGRFEAGAVIACTVAAHDPIAGVTRLAFAGGRFNVPLIALPVGQGVRVRVRARDVALALSEPLDTTISNRLAGTISTLVAREAPYMEAVVDVGGAMIRALITRESVSRLKLAPGLAVYALIKTAAFDGRSVGSLRRPREPGGPTA